MRLLFCFTIITLTMTVSLAKESFNKIDYYQGYYFQLPSNLTYSEIARDLYQETSLWKKIRDINVVKPHQLEEGTIIVLPKEPIYNITRNEQGLFLYKKEDLTAELNKESLKKLDSEKLADFYFKEGKAKYKSGDYKLARETLKKSIELNDNMPAPWIFYLKTLNALKDSEAHEREKTIFIEKFPAYAEFF